MCGDCATRMTGTFSSTGDTKTFFDLNNIIVTLPVSFSDKRKSWACLNNRELKQTRRWRERERHLKIQLRVSAIIFQLFSHFAWKLCSNYPGINLEPMLGPKKTKLNICHHMLTLPTQLQNRSFHVVERTRTSSKCQKMRNARAKRAKILFFTIKYANLWVLVAVVVVVA